MEEHISRAMWRLYEPIHSVVYFHPNATNLANLQSRLADISAQVKRYVGFPANNPIGV